MVSHDLARDCYVYKDDSGVSWAVYTTVENGAAQSADRTKAPLHNPLPRNCQVRDVVGVSSTGDRTRVPVFLNTADIYALGGSFEKSGVTYTVIFRRAESWKR